MTNNSNIKKTIFNYIDNISFPVDIKSDVILHVDKLEKFISLFVEWNGVHNIASSNQSLEDIIELFFDSVIGGKFVQQKDRIFFDAGAGGGFPSIPIALVYSDSQISLIEADRKKCSFLRSVKAQLALESVEILHQRVESCKNLPFIISKAAFSPKNFGVLSHSLEKNGKLALWATPSTAQEYEKEAPKHQLSLIEKHEYELFPNKKRLIIIFEKK